MDPRSPTFEASLLFKDIPTPNLNSLISEIGEILEDHGSPLLQAEPVENGFTLFSCETLQILLAFTDAPLPVEHFLDAHRPAAAGYCEAEMLARLTGHGASATILVVDHYAKTRRSGPRQEALKRAIAWEIADCLCQWERPELVFWCETDTLYAYEEFDRATHYFAQELVANTPEQAPNVTHILPHFAREPEVTEEALGWIDEQIEDAREEFDPSSDHSDVVTLDMLMPQSFPDAKETQSEPVKQRFRARQALNSFIMACSSATIGIVSLPGLTPLFS